MLHQNVRSALLNKFSDMTTVFFAAIIALDYDVSLLGMDLEAVVVELEELIGTQVPLTNRVKLYAAQKVYFTDLFYKDEADFNEIAVIGDDPETPPNFDVFEPADVNDVAWIMFETGLLDALGDETPQDAGHNPFFRKRQPNKGGKMVFSEEIHLFCGALLEMEGCVRPISALPNAILGSRITLDANTDPEHYAAAQERTLEIEAAVAQYVLDRLRSLFNQLMKLPTADGQALVTKKMAQGWLAQATQVLMAGQEISQPVGQ